MNRVHVRRGTLHDKLHAVVATVRLLTVLGELENATEETCKLEVHREQRREVRNVERVARAIREKHRLTRELIQVVPDLQAVYRSTERFWVLGITIDIASVALEPNGEQVVVLALVVRKMMEDCTALGILALKSLWLVELDRVWIDGH